jgi:hypothetical protein
MQADENEKRGEEGRHVGAEKMTGILRASFPPIDSNWSFLLHKTLSSTLLILSLSLSPYFLSLSLLPSFFLPIMSNIHTLPSFTNSPLDTNLRDALNSIVTRMTNLERTNQTLQKMLEDRNGYTVTLEKVLYGLVDDMSKMNTRVDSLEREKNSMSSLISNQQIYLDQQSQHIQALQIRDQQQLILNAEMQNHLRNLQQERELVQQQFAQQQMQMHNMTEEWKSYYRRLLEHTNELRVRLQLAPISMTFQWELIMVIVDLKEKITALTARTANAFSQWDLLPVFINSFGFV